MVLCFLSSGGSTRSFTIQLQIKEYAIPYNMHYDGSKLMIKDNNLPQIFKDWHLMVFTLVIAGIAVVLLFSGTVIPQLRGMITEARDLESPDGLSVCKLKSCMH